MNKLQPQDHTTGNEANGILSQVHVIWKFANVSINEAKSIPSLRILHHKVEPILILEGHNEWDDEIASWHSNDLLIFGLLKSMLALKKFFENALYGVLFFLALGDIGFKLGQVNNTKASLS